MSSSKDIIFKQQGYTEGKGKGKKAWIREAISNKWQLWHFSHFYVFFPHSPIITAK